ncbi:MAG: hypothetical protein K2Y29_20985 [Beijerinckiaceae bacterium]|nr:hypothetical protein [Beijerinckiaceae bacterium]
MIAPERRIRLMADYFCHPLWHDGGVEVGDIDPASLPISEALTSDLDAWARAFDAILDMDDPANKGGFASPQACDDFAARGAELAMRLRDELGPHWEIAYWPPPGARA